MATGVGGMLVISPLLCLLVAPVFFVVVGITRFVSLGSILVAASGAGLAIVLVVIGQLDSGWLLYVLPGAAIIWIAHRDNIGRLLNGTERRFDSGDRGASTQPNSEDTDEPPQP